MKSNFSLQGILIAVCILTATGCKNNAESTAQDRIGRIENSLVPFQPTSAFRFADLLNPVKTDTQSKVTLNDEMKRMNIPGISITVIDNYKIAWAKGYGTRIAGVDSQLNTETMFQSGSTTKVLMGMTILKLVQEGRLDLDADINQYLTSWKMPQHPSGIKVTARMLLTHQSGINRPGNGFDTEPGSNPTLVQFLKGEKPVLNDPVKFDTTPGTYHSYSNFGYLILQQMVQDLLGKSYSQIVQEYIFKPLNLKSSFIEYPFPDQFAGRVIKPHNKQAVPSEDDGLYSSAYAQAGMITTPTDWAMIMMDLMKAAAGKNSRILNQESARMMFTIQRKVDPEEFEGLDFQALGLFLFGDGDKRFFIHHGHNSPGANCLWLGSLNGGKGLVVMTNGMSGLRLALEILPAVAKEYEW
jgi:CubicO group peptidase (beta-lactamase class C family)